MSAFNGGPAQTQSLNVPVGATPISTWANLPDPSTIPGLVYRVTDYGVPGVGLLMISDGTRWLPFGPQLLARSAVAVSVTGTTAETILATVTVPAGALGPSGGLRVRPLWTVTNSANNKLLRVRFGGVSGVAYASNNYTTVASVVDDRTIRNRGSAASQVGGNLSPTPISSSSLSLVTSAIDTSQSQDLVYTAQLALGSETSTLESYEVWLLP